jgi:putative flippase GtrA
MPKLTLTRLLLALGILAVLWVCWSLVKGDFSAATSAALISAGVLCSYVVNRKLDKERQDS